MRTIYVDKDIPKMLAVKALKRAWADVVFSPLSPAHFKDVPEPQLPGPRWVRVQNEMCGICASDLSLLNVDADPVISAAALPGNQRFYLGHEVVSTVTEVGPEVTRVKVGERVLMHTRFMGANCLSQELDMPCRHCAVGDYILCENSSLGQGPRGVGGGWGDGYTAHETEVFPLASGLSDDEAVLVEPLAVGVHTVLRRLPQAGERVMVLGSGIVGLNVIQCARALSPDCHITAVARYPQQVDMARKLGADEIVKGEDGYRATARITGAKLYEGMMGGRMLLGGFDVVFDCVGSGESLQDSLRWARGAGTVVLAGVKLKPLHLDLVPVWYQEVDLIGVNSHGLETWQGRHLQTFELVAELLLAGKLRVEGLITHRFPLTRWREAIQTAQDKRSGAIKVIFDYRLND